MKGIDYNDIAGSYARNRSAYSFVTDELKNGCSLNPGLKILEIGCGTGSYINELVEATGCQGWGIDPSIEMLQRTQNQAKIIYINGKAENLPFQKEFFDFIFSVDVIHHVADIRSFFRESKRVLKPGGALCTVTDSESDIRQQVPLTQYWPDRVEIELQRYHSISTLKQQMMESGFEDIKETHIQHTYKITGITPYREKAFSCLHLIPEESYIQGLRKMEKAFKTGPIQRISMYTCLWGTIK